MNILYYSTFSNQSKWVNSLKKKFKGCKVLTIKDNFDYNKIDVAIVWNLPNTILKKLSNIKVIFSLGAGVDHILNLPSYNQTPIFRIKDSNMQDRMFNHVLSQILNYQLKLVFYQKAQIKKLWLEERETPLNNNIVVGILGLGYMGEHIAKKLKKLDYQVIGYKKSKSTSKTAIKQYAGKQISQFVSSSDIIVSILPSTKETENFINKKFFILMKKNSFLINIGRGSTLNEKDLIDHLNANKNFFVSLDVFKNEPLEKNHKFWKHSNITITPHIAAITDIHSSIDYMYSRFITIKKNSKIKSDVSIIKGY